MHSLPSPRHAVVEGRRDPRRNEVTHASAHVGEEGRLGAPLGVGRIEEKRLGVAAVDLELDDVHPVHLHRGSFELTRIYDSPTAGIMKDVVLVKGFQKVEADFTPSQQGLTLFHCHQQLHMDYGFKMLFDVS